MAGQQEVASALAVAVRARKPVLLWGRPGSGKSSVVRSLGTALGLPVVTVIASLREPTDFAGLPVVRDDGSVRLAEPSWARELAAAGRGILFFDEVTTAAPAVQAALLRVVLERVVGELSLPEAVVVVAAANPPGHAGGGWDLTAPLANRFCHLDWPVDASRYVEALAAGWPVPDVRTGEVDSTGSNAAEPHGVVRGTSEASVRARSVIGGFLRARPALLHAMPDDAAGAGRAWPSPRTWDLAVDLRTAGEEMGVERSVIAALVAGCVGMGAARELQAWEDEADLPDPEEVLRDPARFVLPERGDRQFAVLSALASAVVADPTRERWEAAFSVIEQAVARGAADVAAVAARALAGCVPEGLNALPHSVIALAPVMAKAGLIRPSQPHAS
jgi:hypothetical protein